MIHFHTNSHVYWDIANEANTRAQTLFAASRRPKEDGSAGFIIAFDPSNESFKQSLVAIAFSAIFLEAVLYLAGTTRMGSRWNSQMDAKKYEDKFCKLGLTEPELLESAKRLRLTRRDLLHEKAVPIFQLPASQRRDAHYEAAFAVEFVDRVSRCLQNAA